MYKFIKNYILNLFSNMIISDQVSEILNDAWSNSKKYSMLSRQCIVRYYHEPKMPLSWTMISTYPDSGKASIIIDGVKMELSSGEVNEIYDLFKKFEER